MRNVSDSVAMVVVIQGGSDHNRLSQPHILPPLPFFVCGPRYPHIFLRTHARTTPSIYLVRFFSLRTASPRLWCFGPLNFACPARMHGMSLGPSSPSLFLLCLFSLWQAAQRPPGVASRLAGWMAGHTFTTLSEYCFQTYNFVATALYPSCIGVRMDEGSPAAGASVCAGPIERKGTCTV